MMPSQLCKLPTPCALMHLIPLQMLAFELNTNNKPSGPFPFAHGKYSVHDSKKNLDFLHCDSSGHGTVFHFASAHLK